MLVFNLLRVQFEARRISGYKPGTGAYTYDSLKRTCLNSASSLNVATTDLRGTDIMLDIFPCKLDLMSDDPAQSVS